MALSIAVATRGRRRLIMAQGVVNGFIVLGLGTMVHVHLALLETWIGCCGCWSC
jgi:hypothetical protein